MLLLSICYSLVVQAQKIQVTGNVTDENNLPMVGANVLIKDTTQGAVTDFDGNFTIEAENGQTLVVSYINYLAKEIIVTDSNTINVQLQPDQQSLEQVVIVGYGSQKKSDLTGAVGTLKGEEINSIASANVTQSLQGRIAGVRVEQNGGAPGAEAFVTIRGSGTLSDVGPLYVVDGLLTNSISFLNPDDIETISVLKDASASAIYGSRAANGVIIVTTKKGDKGRGITVDFDINYGSQRRTTLLGLANARQYANIRNASNDNDGVDRAPANDTEYNPNIDTSIEEESLRDAPILNANFRISGGGDNATYSVSSNHLDQDGIVKASAFERTTFRVNTTFEKGKFRLEENIGLTRSIDNPNPYFNIERDHIPTAPIFSGLERFEGGFAGTADPEGGLAFHGVEDVINTLGLATLEERSITRNGVLGNVIGSYEILNGFTYKLNLGLDYASNNNFRYTPTYFFAASNSGQNDTSTLRETNTNSFTTLIENTLEYKTVLNKDHALTLLGGYTEQKSNTRSLGIVATDFPSNDIRVASAAGNLQEAPSNETITGLRSYFGRVNYTYKDRYLLTSTIRRDGSSLFRSKLRWGTFASIALGWNIINEPFMANQTLFDNLKLRGSYGEIGSNNIRAYAINPVLNPSSEFIFGGTNVATGFAVVFASNPNLIWETTTTTDIGAEMAFLQNRLQLTVDYFKKKSKDILVNDTPITSFSGFEGGAPSNAATIENNGLEFLVGYRDQFGKLSLDVSANITFLDNEVLSLGNDDVAILGGAFTSNGSRNITRTEPGQPIGAFYGFKVLGIYQSDAEAVADGRTDAVAGDLKFQDTDGNGVLDDDDKVFLGSPIPDFEYGITIGANYKNFDLNMFFNGVQGNKIANGSKWRYTFDTTSNYLAEVTNAWTPTNTNTSIPRATLLDLAGNGRPSDYLIEDGSYFRLRNVQLGYSLPSKIASFVKASRVRVYAAAQNLFTITSYSGYYPEVGRNNRGGFTRRLFSAGVDERAYPVARMYQFGIQASF